MRILVGTLQTNEQGEPTTDYAFKFLVVRWGPSCTRVQMNTRNAVSLKTGGFRVSARLKRKPPNSFITFPAMPVARPFKRAGAFYLEGSMPVAEYPSLTTAHTSLYPFSVYPLRPAYQIGFTQYDDGGRDFKLQNGGTGILRWIIDYSGLTAAQAATLDAHADSAMLDESGMSAFSFNFRDRDTGTLYSGVRYEVYSRPAHTHKDIQSRHVQLVKFG